MGITKWGSSGAVHLDTQNLPEGFYTIRMINTKTGKSEAGTFVKTQ
ncbi:MAG TPA: hypothetical protein PLD84_16535 [Chitinophagales bacterium]|nr:hypothetical protein [Chitinophagales bacterium]